MTIDNDSFSSLLKTARVIDVKGCQFAILDPEEHIQQFWLTEQFYEQEMLEFIFKYFRGGTFIDIGACHGNHTIFFSRIADLVVAFEPVASTFLHLNLNITLNRASNVVSHLTALGDKCEVRTVFQCSSVGMSSLIDLGEGTTHTVETLVTTLDDYELNNVKLVKIDVEGFALEVLHGSKKTIQEHRPAFFIEIGDDNESSSGNLEDIKKFLSQFAYHCYAKPFNATPTYLFTTDLDFLSRIESSE